MKSKAVKSRAACLGAAAARPQQVRAIVSKGGRPDLAFDVLSAVRTPTLLIVGSSDVNGLKPNAWAASDLQTSHAIKVVGGLAISLKSLAA